VTRPRLRIFSKALVKFHKKALSGSDNGDGFRKRNDPVIIALMRSIQSIEELREAVTALNEEVGCLRGGSEHTKLFVGVSKFSSQLEMEDWHEINRIVIRGKNKKLDSLIDGHLEK